MDNTELEKAVNEFGLDIILEIADALRAVGANNTGELINSLRSELRDTGKGLELFLKSKGYFEIIEKGRKPGKQPPISDLKRWAQRKGLPEKAVFPIAKNIGKFGIKPRPVLKQIINSNKFKEGYQLIGEAYAKDVRKEIKNIINKK